MDLISAKFYIEFREVCVSLCRRQIEDIFSSANIDKGQSTLTHITGERRQLVQSYYASINWESEEDVQKFLNVVNTVSKLPFLKEDLYKLCVEEDLVITDKGIDLPPERRFASKDLFQRQFPVGLPFGLKKPSFKIFAKDDSQLLEFELAKGKGIGIIKGNIHPIYPDFSFQNFCKVFDYSAKDKLFNRLLEINQTDAEKHFLKAYADRFSMINSHVPILIPQAWIQWHSQTKKDLRESNSSYEDEMYRIDFVAFWQNQRYAILIDDIGHYAKKENASWIANESVYSQRLKEDRRLRQQNWQVYRVSNWEIRNEQALSEVIEGLASFINFNYPPTEEK